MTHIDATTTQSVPHVPRTASVRGDGGAIDGLGAFALFTLTAAAYLFLVQIGLMTIPVHGDFAIVWPGSSVVGTIVYLTSGRRRLAAMAGAVAAVAVTKTVLGTDIPEIAAFSALSVLGPFVFAVTLGAFLPPSEFGRRPESLFAMLVAAILGAVTSAAVGSSALSFFYGTPLAARLLQWTLGESVGIGALAPLFVHLNFLASSRLSRGRRFEGGVYLAALVGIALSSFRIGLYDPVFAFPTISWVTFPILLLATVRGSQAHGTAGLAAVVAVGTSFIVSRSDALGPPEAIGGTVLLFQTFVLSALLCMAIVGVYARERERDAVAEREREVLESVTDGVLSVDPSTGAVTFANAKGREMLGVGGLADDVVPEARIVNSAVLALAARAMREGQPQRDALGSEASGRWFEVDAYPGARSATLYVRDVTEEKRAQQQVALMAREMNHRVKNFFAVANAIVGASSRGAGSPEEMSRTILERFSALHRCYEVTRTGSGRIGDGEENPDLGALVDAFLSPYRDEDPDRIASGGPTVSFPYHAVTTLTLVLHELTTNSVKYGALGRAEGRLSFRWAFEDVDGVPSLSFRWDESGVPGLAAPTRKGFGTRMIEQSIRQMEARIEYDWRPDGMSARIVMPASAV